ncbi:MAG TPA: creatininase family protein [Usitatibacter sp.]|nr:creatininase family protein [Usitatibacter sp.]
MSEEQRCIALACLLLCTLTVRAEVPDTVFLEDLTWTEVRDALKAGKTTVLLPTGGTEQNGPHMVLGKHNYIVRYASDRIARRLGNALVAPVMAYVPEGDVGKKEGHMAFPGTITLPDEHFRKVVEFAARSFKAHGFQDIVFLGDSGPNQPGMKAVAEILNKEWAKTPVRVHYIPEYYTIGYDLKGGFSTWLQGQGESLDDIGGHAGITDTSQLMAIDRKLVRADKLAPGGDFNATGVWGNPKRATVAYGRKGLDLKVDAAVAQIRASMAARGQAPR